MYRFRPPSAGGGPTLARDTALSLVAISLVGGSAAVYNVAVGRVLGQTALGHAGVALAVGLGVAQVATAGVAPAITRFAAARRASGDHAAALGWQPRGKWLGARGEIGPSRCPTLLHTNTCGGSRHADGNRQDSGKFPG